MKVPLAVSQEYEGPSFSEKGTYGIFLPYIFGFLIIKILDLNKL